MMVFALRDIRDGDGLTMIKHTKECTNFIAGCCRGKVEDESMHTWFIMKIVRSTMARMDQLFSGIIKDYASSPRSQAAPHAKIASCLCIDLLNGDALRNISQLKLACCPVDVEHSKLGNDGADSASTGQWKSALPQDLWLALLGSVFHHNDYFGLLRVGDKIHRTPNTCLRDNDCDCKSGEGSMLADL
jgi:hypothetical protein